MKKNILILLFILFIISSNLFSQSHMGLVGGFNLAQLSGDYNNFYGDSIILVNKNDKTDLLRGDSIIFKSQNFRPGIYVGLMWDINLKYKTYLQVGVIYSQQGSILKRTYFSASETSSQKITYKAYSKINYIMLPLTWKQLWGELYTQVGVFGSIKVQSDSEWKRTIDLPNAQNIDKYTFPEFEENIRIYDFGVFFGLGFQVPVSHQYDWFLGVSYRQGFFPLQEDVYRAEDVLRNRVFTINTGIIMFGKGGRNKRRRR